jgi:hypothetical protein
MTIKYVLFSFFILSSLIGNNIFGIQTEQNGLLLSQNPEKTKKLLQLIKTQKCDCHQLTFYKYHKVDDSLTHTGALSGHNYLAPVSTSELAEITEAMDRDEFVLCEFSDGSKTGIYNTKDITLCPKTKKFEEFLQYMWINRP